jgi:hypothetical protein
MKTNFKYEWSDIWLLQAIISGGGDEGASLYNIISIGDALNHAIFTDEELEGGFARLTEGKLIEERDGRFFATTEAKDIYSKASSKSGSIFTIRDRVAKAIDAAPWQPQISRAENTPKYPGFSSEGVAEAIRQYQKEAMKFVRKKHPTRE